MVVAARAIIVHAREALRYSPTRSTMLGLRGALAAHRKNAA
jgi:hypothetical protein